jgi:hypothetical protein
MDTLLTILQILVKQLAQVVLLLTPQQEDV